MDLTTAYFDSGWDFLAMAEEQGFQPAAQYGEWPYDVVMYKVNTDHSHTIARYTEGDITIKTLETVALTDYLKSLPRYDEYDKASWGW